MRRVVLSLVVAVLFSTSLSAQVAQNQAPGRSLKDPQALDVVQASVNALGGAPAIGQVQSWQAQGQVQGVSPNGESVSGTVTWESAGAEFRMVSSTNLGPWAIMTGHGNPAFVGNGAVTNLPAHVISAQFVPALVGSLLSKELQSPGYFIRYGGTKTLGSASVTLVTTIEMTKAPDNRATVQTWYFDNTTHLPVRVEYRLPSQQTALVFSSGAVDLSNYQPASGVLYPFQITTYAQGKQLSVVTIQSVNVNAAIAPSDFDPPAGGAQ